MGPRGSRPHQASPVGNKDTKLGVRKPPLQPFERGVPRTLQAPGPPHYNRARFLWPSLLGLCPQASIFSSLSLPRPGQSVSTERGFALSLCSLCPGSPAGRTPAGHILNLALSVIKVTLRSLPADCLTLPFVRNQEGGERLWPTLKAKATGPYRVLALCWGLCPDPTGMLPYFHREFSPLL